MGFECVNRLNEFRLNIPLWQNCIDVKECDEWHTIRVRHPRGRYALGLLYTCTKLPWKALLTSFVQCFFPSGSKLLKFFVNPSIICVDCYDATMTFITIQFNLHGYIHDDRTGRRKRLHGVKWNILSPGKFVRRTRLFLVGDFLQAWQGTCV
jgi:hypothetical protein